MEKCKITVEIPTYLKEWLQSHDISNNAMVTLLLRKEFLAEKNASENKIISQLKDFFETKKLPF